MSAIESLMQAALTASEERRQEALRVLRGDALPLLASPVAGPLLLSTAAAAKYLGVNRGTLWRACKAGRLSRVELFPGSYRLRREDLIALANGKVGENAPPPKRGRPRKEQPTATSEMQGNQQINT